MKSVMMRSVEAVLLAVLSFSCLLAPAMAWGTWGHEIVANLAWSRLESDVQDWISSILNITEPPEDGNSPLGAVADWADRVRIYYHWSGALHYIDIRDDVIDGGCPIRNVTKAGSSGSVATTTGNVCSFEYERDCPNDICVAGAIQNYTSQLEAAVVGMSSSTSDEKFLLTKNQLRGSSKSTMEKNVHYDDDPTRQALKFLTHFIGDIHQPLHVSRSTDKGGNDFHVHFHTDFLPCMEEGTFVAQSRHRRGQVDDSSHHHSWNLHSVWDTAMIEAEVNGSFNASRAVFESYLIDVSQSPDYEERIEQWSQCGDGGNKECTTQWGEEGWEAAIQYAYQNTDGTEVHDGSTLTQDYFATRFPIVQDRLIAAGVRLAETLKVIYSSE